MTSPSRPNSLLIGTFLLSLAAVLFLWLSIPDSLSAIPLLPLMNIFYLVAIALILGAQASLACLNLLRPGASRMVAILLMILLIPQLRWLQLYTGAGVLVLNGAGYWVHRAATSEDESEGRECLRIVLRSTHYGVNLAENEVLDLPPEARYRLFSLLVELAPSDHWRQHFQHRVREAEAILRSKQNAK